MMVLRIDPGSEQAALLSLPRDLWVPMASGGNQRINAAIENGGPRGLIDTTEGYLGIPINHYLPFDFAGFRDLVSAIHCAKVGFGHTSRTPRLRLAVDQPRRTARDLGRALAYDELRRAYH